MTSDAPVFNQLNLVVGDMAATRSFYGLLGLTVPSGSDVGLMGPISDAHKGKPPRTFAAGAGPDHPRSVPVRPLSTRVEQGGEGPVLVLDFGGTVLKVAVDPAELQKALAAPQA